MKSLFALAFNLILFAPMWLARARDRAREVEAESQVGFRWRGGWNRHSMKGCVATFKQDADMLPEARCRRLMACRACASRQTGLC